MGSLLYMGMYACGNCILFLTFVHALCLVLFLNNVYSHCYKQGVHLFDVTKTKYIFRVPNEFN